MGTNNLLVTWETYFFQHLGDSGANLFKWLLWILVFAEILQYLEQKEMVGDRAKMRPDLDVAGTSEMGGGA